MATLITNAVDFASRADKPSSVVTPQLIAMPVTFAATSLIGILIASSSVSIFGEFVWSPIDVMNGLLDQSQSHGTRAGCAFIAIGFIIAQLGTNISANSISAGCDTTALCPRFLTFVFLFPLPPSPR
jgi:NCS1 family nucleobase:cation symporter-1